MVVGGRLCVWPRGVWSCGVRPPFGCLHARALGRGHVVMVARTAVVRASLASGVPVEPEKTLPLETLLPLEFVSRLG